MSAALGARKHVRVARGKLGEAFPFAQARARAREVLGKVAGGHDPARERKQQLDAPLFSSLAERFMQECDSSGYVIALSSPELIALSSPELIGASSPDLIALLNG